MITLILILSIYSAILSTAVLVLLKRAKRNFGAVCIDVRGSIDCRDTGQPAISIQPDNITIQRPKEPTV